ncbi:Sodium/calcium exchanger protein-domain-containing protein [Dichotomopilus funicola]|uniref:Sodium/calcium exchanger protein-domain-containing protein n=1 Tax=Dichotomopilus funicola TaxID=1934379 RepID=A0AAN6VAZ0_9PEZI|nr:Sodium/calcium exchanger protein-domain-containing protein [Dichotomopilus funicola]
MRKRYGARPVVGAALLIATIAALALLQSVAPGLSSAQNHAQPKRAAALLHAADADCRDVHQAADQCAFVLANCEDDEAGLIHYLSFYYCTLASAKPVAFTIMALWLGLLFTTIGIAASDFFSVNLSTIASVLGLSESLAGVTFLAFGNGSPDVFSTFAAMGSNSGSMAVGELIGAAGFITAVVAGSMALVREFKVSKRTFVRDIVFFIIAISFTMVFLADGELHLWECFAMIAFYVFYVIVVVGWHWFAVRRRRQRLRDVAARAHLYHASGQGSEEIEPYRDEPDEGEDGAPVGGRSNSAPEPADMSILERGPRIEVDGVSPTEDEEEEERGRHVAAEMASSMRVNRPRWGRSNTTITPIRPSLLGVLEFRSVLSSLQKERNMRLRPLFGRSHTSQEPPVDGIDEYRGRPRTQTMPPHIPRPDPPALSASPGDHPPPNLGDLGLNHSDPALASHTRTSSASRIIDGMLAPPLDPGLVPPSRDPPSPKQSPQQSLQLRIPSPSGGSSGASSPLLSPFPGLSESPAALSPVHGGPTGPLFPAPTEVRRSSFPLLDDRPEVPKPVSWWPYSILPAPHVLLATIFPTLQGWKGKSWWDKLVSLISVPSIFLLVATLPVVETENDDSEADSDVVVADPPDAGQPGNTAPAVMVEDGEIEPETEWQAYRRRTRSISSRSYSPHSRSLLSRSPSFPSSVADNNRDGLPADQEPPQLSLPVPQLNEPITPVSDRPATTNTTSDGPQPPTGWNRWLVAVQLFTGPLFIVFIIWANTAADMSSPRQTVLHMILYSLLVSLCLLAALLLTTSPHHKPQYHFLLCFLGFVISVAWISTIAGEVVGVLKAFGVILDISEAILGLTVFAVGNSLGDLVADVTVARLGYPVMALAACFGGPMLNILLGVGIGGAWMGISKAQRKQRQHPGRPLKYKPYRIQVGGTLMVSALTVLLTLVVLLIVVPSNRWVMSRRIGWGLIGIWTVGTVVNLAMEVTGAWADVSAWW